MLAFVRDLHREERSTLKRKKIDLAALSDEMAALYTVWFVVHRETRNCYKNRTRRAGQGNGEESLLRTSLLTYSSLTKLLLSYAILDDGLVAKFSSQRDSKTGISSAGTQFIPIAISFCTLSERETAFLNGDSGEGER
jgi:hypothetical protein